MSARDCLLVDDDTIGAAYLAGLLAGHGLQVRHACTLAAADAQLRAALPAWLVVDRRLPDGDGLRWLAQVLPSWDPPPRCLVCSGDAIDPGDLPPGVASLRKPLAPEALHDWLGGRCLAPQAGVAEPAAQASPLLDDVAALARLGGSADALLALRRMFADELAASPARAPEGVPADALAALLHRMRTGCALTGCARLALVCARAEALLHGADALDADSAAELAACVAATHAALCA